MTALALGAAAAGVSQDAGDSRANLVKELAAVGKPMSHDFTVGWRANEVACCAEIAQ